MYTYKKYVNPIILKKVCSSVSFLAMGHSRSLPSTAVVVFAQFVKLNCIFCHNYPTLLLCQLLLTHYYFVNFPLSFSRHLKLQDSAVFRFSGEIEENGNTPKTCVIFVYIQSTFDGRNSQA